MGFKGLCFSIIIISSSKWVDISQLLSSNDPDWLIERILSFAPKSPNSSPLFSTFNLLTLVSNHIFLADNVETPTDFNSIFLTLFFVRILPTDPFPLIDNSAKLKSIFRTFKR